MIRSTGAQRGIAVLACCVLGACAIDNRVGRLETAPSENEGAFDPMEASGNTATNSSGPDSPATAGAEPGVPPVKGDGTETAIAPVLPPPESSGASSGAGSAQGVMEAGAPGQGAGGAGASSPAASSPAAMLDGMPPPPVTEPEVIGGCFNQLLRNADFERGREGWTEVSELRDLIVWRDHPDLLPTGVTPQAGNYLAWIGGIRSGDFTMYRTRLTQQVAVPAEAVSLTFSGYAWAAQPEPGLATPDWAILEVVDPDPSSTYLWQTMYWEEAGTGAWVYFEKTWTDVSRFAGKTVPVQVHNTPNGNGLLSVWLDSLRLEARCPR